jgi:arsenate reductase
MKKATKIMFICMANSCRSQMAEGFAREYGEDRVEVYSAGLMAAGVHRKASAVMMELGIDISEQKSKIIDIDTLAKMDIMVTLCSHVETVCPYTPPGVTRIHWPIMDPVGMIGSEEIIMKDFRRARDEIQEKVRQLLEEITANRYQ